MSNIQILNFLNELKSDGELTDVLVRLRSFKDVDIICITEDSKLDITKIKIESSLYTKPYLNIDLINRNRGKILALTKDKVTYEISVISKSEFDKQNK